MKLATIQNRNGNAFNMRIVFKGETYGQTFRITHDKDIPLVEFYDIRYKFDELDGIMLGQFVTRYSIDTMKDVGKYGLDMMGGVEGWQLDAKAIKEMKSLFAQWGL